MNNRRRLVVGFGRVRLPGLQSCILAAMALTAVLISTRGQAADTPPPVVATAPLPAVKFDPDALVARLQREEYRELDAELNAYLSAYEADTHAELAAVRAIEAFERSRPELEQHFNAWIAAYPQSYAARLARGLYYSRMAWSHRGGNYICNTPVERLDAMNKYFDRASADLNAASKLSAKPILSYAFLINIAMARGDDGQKRQLLEKALQLDPYHARGRRIYIHSLQPEWGGSYEAMTAFVQSTKRYPETPKLREIVASLESDVLSRRARDSYRAKDYKTALDYLGRAFQLSEDAGVLLMRAPTLGKLDRNQEAVDDLSKAIELNPNLTEAYMRRAQFYRIFAIPKTFWRMLGWRRSGAIRYRRIFSARCTSTATA